MFQLACDTQFNLMTCFLARDEGQRSKNDPTFVSDLPSPFGEHLVEGAGHHGSVISLYKPFSYPGSFPAE